MTKAKPFNPIKPTTDPAWRYRTGETKMIGAKYAVIHGITA